MFALLLLAPLSWAGFTNGTSAAGLSGLSNSAAAFADYDADGDPDLYVSGQLWNNDGAAVFTLAAMDPSMAGSGLWGDFDNDGDLDLYTWYYAPRLFLQDASDADGWSYDAAGFDTSAIYDSRGAALGDYDGDGLLDVYIGAYETPSYWPDEMFLNDGDGTLSLWWEEPPEGPYSKYVKPARGVTACDFDEDHDLDVYVSNYRLEINYLWLNDGAATLLEASIPYGVEGDDDGWAYSYGHTIGSAWGDLDSDGHFDLFVGNFSHPYYWQDEPKFLANLGPDEGYVFEDRTDGAGLGWQESFATPALGDYDNDGDLDLFFTTVYSGDYPVLYRNNGDWTFTNVTSDEGLAGLGATYQAAWADVDVDGDLDLATAGALYVNDGNDNHWLLLRLEGNGVTTNRAAIGAQVRIEVDGLVVTRQVEAGTGEHNANDLTLHFGLGDWGDPVDLIITWPDGTEDVVLDVDVDQVTEVVQCIDLDGDGSEDAACGGDDCDDLDATVIPGAEETWYDGVDSNCDGGGDYDADRDGHDSADYGGYDCEDTDPTIYLGAEDVWYDGVDSDCDGRSDYDADTDGYDSAAWGGEDCDDSNPEVSPEAEEDWYDGVDGDCDGMSDIDADQDGYESLDWGGEDCDDLDPQVAPGVEETWYDGIDSDCDGWSDYDADGDGYDSADWGGDDCDDADPDIAPGAYDAWYDGVDSDCDGANDYDADQDGYDAAAANGADCDDLDPLVHPGTDEIAWDGVDQDCDGSLNPPARAEPEPQRGCATAGRAGSGVALLLALGLIARRRRARPQTMSM